MKEENKVGSSSTFEKSLRLIRRRAIIDSMVRRTHVFVIILSCLYLALLLFSRATGLMPDYFSPISIAVPVLFGAILGAIFHRRYSKKNLARIIDAKMKTKDLFLTTVLLEESFGEYRPLVLENAHAESAKIKPHIVVTYKWNRELANAAGVLVILLLFSIFMPQLDPFGRNQARKKKQESNALLNKMDEEVKKRLEELKKKSEGKNSPEVARAVEDLKKIFDNLKMEDKKFNAQKLQDMQKELNSMMKGKNEEKMQDMLNRGYSQQSFGRMSDKAEKWKEQVQKGDYSGVKKEISEMKDMAEKLSAMADSPEKKKQEEELGQRLKELSNFSKNEIGSKSLQASLDTAMKEMGMGGEESAGNDAMSSVSNSMQLGERELERLEEMINDMKALESAARAAQLAKMLNELEKIKNASGQGFEDMMDYQKFYEDLMKQAQGEGEGEGGMPGEGKPGDPGKGGGFPGENENAKTDFKDELSRSKLQAGKTLMEWKERQVTESGAVKEEYLETIKEVKQGVSEAIVKEQVPPGYHDAIKNYFSTLGSGDKAEKK